MVSSLAFQSFFISPTQIPIDSLKVEIEMEHDTQN